jgi:hypothetical protein
MITCDLRGGLGNQLFEIFTTISYAIKAKIPFKFLNIKSMGGGTSTIRYTFWETFLSNLKPFLIENLTHPVHIIKESGFPYKDLSVYEMINTRNTVICGYFQSYKYFQHNFTSICRLIGIDKMKNTLLEKLQTIYGENIVNEGTMENTISMHFRIGDYKKVSDFHPILKYEYYHLSLNRIQSIYPNNGFTVYYFCEDEDIQDVSNKISILKINFPNYYFIRGDNTLADWEQMLFMSCCQHNIIANSSFSWWGAYFNSKMNRIVCYPSVWFGASANIDTCDLCPPEWIKIGI